MKIPSIKSSRRGSNNKIFKKLTKFAKSRRTIVAIVTVIVIVFLDTRGGADTKQIKLAQVQEKSIEAKVTASGSVKSESDTTLRFPVSGKVAWVGVKEGNFVYKGQAIASLDKEKFEIALRQAEQDVNQADAILSQVYDDLKKFSPPENFDQKIKRTNAETAKNKAYDAMKKAEKDLRDTNLTSPTSGTIVNLGIMAGQEIPLSFEVGQVADLNKLQFVSEVDETEIGKVKIGQTAKIILDAFPDDSTEAPVIFIGPKAVTTSTGATAYEVKFNLDPSLYRLGMNGETNIVTQSAQNAIVVPFDAIIDDKYVWIRKDNIYQKNEVTKGIEADLEIQITSGLTKDGTVVRSGFNQINKKSLFGKILDWLK